MGITDAICYLRSVNEYKPTVFSVDEIDRKREVQLHNMRIFIQSNFLSYFVSSLS